MTKFSKRFVGVWGVVALFALTFSPAFGQTEGVRKGLAASDVRKGSERVRRIDLEDLPSQPLSLEEAVDFGLMHNRSLKSFKEDVMAADQQVKQARADFFPKLDAGYKFTKLKEQPFISFGGGSLVIPGLPMQIPTSISTINHWELDITQPLFTGFNLTSQLNISKMNLKVTQFRFDSARLDLVRNIKYGFLRVLLGEKLLQVAQDNIKALQVEQRNAEAYYQQGLTAKNDVLKANVALAEAVQRERATAKQLTTLRSQLNQLLDVDISTQLELKDRVVSTVQVPELEQLYLAAGKRRPELIALDTSIQRAEEGIQLAQSAYYPQVSAFGQYFREGQDFLGTDNPYTNEHNAAVGVQIQWNWFEGGKTEAAAREYKYRKRSLQEQRRDLETQIKVQVEDAYEQLNVAKADIQTTEVALKQAEENERMTCLQYDEQLVIFLEVLNARLFVLQSSVNYYQALYGYQMALADLQRAVGGELGREIVK